MAYGLALIGQVLGMFERHVDEPALDGIELLVVGRRDSLAGEAQGERIAGERCGRIPVDAARKLVERDDGGEPATRGLLCPRICQPARQRLDACAKAQGERRVHGLAAGLPAVVLRATVEALSR